MSPRFNTDGMTVQADKYIDHTLFARSQRILWIQQILIAVLAASAAAALGPLWPLAAVTAGGLFLTLAFGSPRLVIGVFITFMIITHQFRSFMVFPFAGVVWHPREFMLGLLVFHFLLALLQNHAKIRWDWTSVALSAYTSFYLLTAIRGLMSGYDLHLVIGECRYPIFLVSFFVLSSLIQDKTDLYRQMRWILYLAILIALLSLAFFAFTLITQSTVNTQNALGEYVARQFGPIKIQSVRPNGHIFFEVGIVLCAALALSGEFTRRQRILLTLICLVFTAAIAIMIMRTAYITVLISLALLFLLYLPISTQMLIATSSAAAIVIVFAFFGDSLHSLLQSTLPSLDVSLQGRLVEIRGAWEVFLENPTLGAGMGSTFKGIGLAAKTSQVGYGAQDFQTIHNVLMYFLFKGGMFGVLLALGGLFGILFRGYTLIYTLADVRARIIVRGLVAAYGGQLIASLAMPRLTYPIGAIFVSMIAAAFVILGEHTESAVTMSEEDQP